MIIYFRAIHGKRATPKLKSWADIVKKPAIVEKKKSIVNQKPVLVVKPPTPRPITKVDNYKIKITKFFF